MRILKSLYILLLLFSLLHGQEKNKVEFKGPYLGQELPGNKSTLFAKDFISTKFGELNSVFTSDGKEFYFSRRAVPGKPCYIMKSTAVGDVWKQPEPVEFSSKYHDIDLFFINDSTMVFCSNRPLRYGQPMKMDSDFWLSKRKNGAWGEPVPFAENAVSNTYDFYPVVTSNGNLYFNSQREGKGCNDIYCSRLINGVYSTAEKLPAPINTEYREFDAFVSKDEQMIIYSSEKPGGFGKGDIYISFKNEEGKWIEPVNLGNEINSAADEYGASISPDGKYFFYTSFKGGNEDIYWIDAGFIKEIRNRVLDNKQ